MDSINSLGRVLIAFDEAQNLRGKLATNFISLSAHCYDYCSNVSFILTGSEVGFLYDLLRIDDAESPLYGRHLDEVKVSRFDRELSLEFLNAGFRESGLEVSNNVLEYAVSKLDGIAGCLTEFGLQSLKSKPTKQLIDEVFSKAAKTSINEVAHFSKQYLDVVEAIGMGKDRWSDIKRFIYAKRRRDIYDAELSRYLTKLKKRGYIISLENGQYRLLDPILENYFAAVR